MSFYKGTNFKMDESVMERWLGLWWWWC